jgi:preprotein translocase SecE subunit
MSNITLKEKKSSQVAVKKNPNSGSFIEETIIELKKVSWPSNDVILKGSILILFIVVFFTILIGATDILLGKVMVVLNQQFGG